MSIFDRVRLHDVQCVLRNWRELSLVTPPAQADQVDYDVVAFVSAAAAAAGSCDVDEDADGEQANAADCRAASPSI